MSETCLIHGIEKDYDERSGFEVCALCEAAPKQTEALAMTEPTPQGREKGTGERARELAHSVFNMHTCGGFDKGMPQWDIERATKLLAGALAAVRLETIEEIAIFAETHYCIIKADAPGGYKTETREKHPNEPFARAIRALGERAAEGK